MSDTIPTVTATVATPTAAPAPPRSVGEAFAALIEPQFLLALVLMVVAARIIDSLLRNGNEGMQSQILMVATTILGFIGGAYFGANMLAKGTAGTTATATSNQGTKP